ncbi:MAG: hypothetical protein AAF757_05260 [Cyanobacteria bacterium P01_D01_bin.116]
MTQENRSIDIARDVKESVIIPGNSNTATITITNYYYQEHSDVPTLLFECRYGFSETLSNLRH